MTSPILDTPPQGSGTPPRRPGLVRRIRSTPTSVIVSIVVLAVFAVWAAFGGWLAPNATHQDVLQSLVPPGTDGHLLGTDELGRDVGALAIAGTASAIVGPLVIALGSMVLGIVFGTLAGYERGWIDVVVGRLTDILLALPLLLVAIVVGGVFDSGYWVLVALLIILFCPTDIRIIRAGVLEQAPRPYVEAARMLSLSPWRIMFVHILPNVRPLILTNMLLNVGFALVSLSSLSYLGVGVQPGTADWGRQIADGRNIMFDNPAAVLTPAILIIAAALAVNLVGDWIGRKLDQGVLS